jgi:predicted PurR-regulated permease PerM
MEHKNIYSLGQRRTLLVGSMLLLLFFILYGLKDYLSAILGSIILFILFLPLYRYLNEKKKWRAGLVSVTLIVLSFVLIVLPFLFLSVLLSEKIIYYTSHYQEILRLVESLEKMTGLSLTDRATVTGIATNLGSFLSNLFPQLVTGALDVFIILGLMYFIMHYLQVNNRGLKGWITRYLPFSEKTIFDLTAELKASVNANVLGLGIISLVQAVLVGLSFRIFGLPDAFFWGLISFFAAFIPVLGTPLVWGPGAVYLFAMGETGKGIGLLLAGAVVIMNIDNLLRLYIARQMGDTHPLITILGVILGVPYFGILGLVIGPLMLSYLLILVRVYEHEYPADDQPEESLPIEPG